MRISDGRKTAGR